MIFFVVMLFYRLADEYSGQVSEDEGLDSRHQQLEEEHEYRERQGDNHETTTYISIEQGKYEYQADNAENNDVTGKHICKKTYHEGYRLNEQRDELDKYQQDLYAKWNVGRIEQVAPEVFVTAGHHYYKCDEGKTAGNSDVTCEVSATRQQAEETVDPDKEEGCEQQRHKLQVFITQVWLSYFVTEEYNNHFKRILETRWGNHSVFVFLSSRCNQPQEEYYTDDHGKDVLGDREVVNFSAELIFYFLLH